MISTGPRPEVIFPVSSCDTDIETEKMKFRKIVLEAIIKLINYSV